MTQENDSVFRLYTFNNASFNEDMGDKQKKAYIPTETALESEKKARPFRNDRALRFI